MAALDGVSEWLWVGWRDARGWTAKRMDNRQPLGGPCRVHVDEDNRVHVLYRLDNALQHATLAGDVWAIEPATDPLPRSIGDVAVDADSLGDLHVGLALSGPGVTYTSNAGGSWTHESLREPLEGVGGYVPVALAVDGSDVVHIVQSDSLLSRSGEGWTATPLGMAIRFRRTLAFGPAGAVHAISTANAAFVYVHRVGEAWTTWSIDAYGPLEESLAMALDVNGNGHVVYYRGFRVHYATNAR